MDVNVIAVCRTLNEEANIERFCREYSKIADRILIADGGSSDRTVEIAQTFDKVTVEMFTKRVNRGSVWRNPHGEHINFMIRWAENHNADWIIYDDCDSIPNRGLKQALPSAFELTFDMIGVRRLYLFKDEGYFHDMSYAGYAKWAWRSHVKVRADESDPWVHHMEAPPVDSVLYLEEPCCLLHYSWPDDAEIERKAKFYAVAKEAPDWHPENFGGEVRPLPEWAVL